MVQASDLEGIIPAVIVPMGPDYALDLPAYRRYLEWVISQGAVGLAVNVDTGEGPYLTADERAEVIRTTREVADGRSFVMPARTSMLASVMLDPSSFSVRMLVRFRSSAKPWSVTWVPERSSSSSRVKPLR